MRPNMECVMASSAPLYRDDTLFGVCQALGEDFGFNPNLPRAALGVGLLFAPVATIIGYGVAGLIVGIARWFVPDPVVSLPEAEIAEPVEAHEEQEELPLAA